MHESGEMFAFYYQVEGAQVKISTLYEKAKRHHECTKPYAITLKTKKALKFVGRVIRKKVNHTGLHARPLIGFEAEDKQAAEIAIKDFV